MYPTKNDIPAAKRKKTADILGQLLLDAIDLKAQIKQAHWNVKGENFIALHELFDVVATEVEAAVDMIAERIVQLGGEAVGTVRVAAKRSRLKEYPHTVSDGQKHAEALASAVAAFNGYGRKNIDDTDALGDAITADLLTGVVRGLDKQLWFIESHVATMQAKNSRISSVK